MNRPCSASEVQSQRSVSAEVAREVAWDVMVQADLEAKAAVMNYSWEVLVDKFSDEERHPIWKQLQNSATLLPHRIQNSDLLVIGASYQVDFEKRSQGVFNEDEYGFFSSIDANYIAIGNDGYNLPAQLFVDFNDEKPWVLKIRESLAHSLSKISPIVESGSQTSPTNDACKYNDIDISLEDTAASLSDLQFQNPMEQRQHVHQYNRRNSLQNLPEKKFKCVMIDAGVIEHLWRAHEDRTYFVSAMNMPSLPSLQSLQAQGHAPSDAVLDEILSPLLKFLNFDLPDAEFVTPAGIYYMKKMPWTHVQGVDKGTDDRLEIAYRQIEEVMRGHGFSVKEVRDYGFMLNGFERKYWIWKRDGVNAA